MSLNLDKQIVFGDTLQKWRKKRRFSQLSFAVFADVSSRHLSFLETGRAKPSREMVLKLADCLKMPKSEINRALLAAGFSPAYIAHKSEDIDLIPIQRAIDVLITNHMPYPAIVLDRSWNLIGANEAAEKFLNEAGFSGYGNLLEALIAQSPSESFIINWEESVGLVLERVRTEILSLGEDIQLMNLEQKLTLRFNKHCPNPMFNRSQAVIPTRFKIKGKIVSLFSSISQFGSVQDLTLDDIKVELMFPLDQSSKNYFLL